MNWVYTVVFYQMEEKSNEIQAKEKRVLKPSMAGGRGVSRRTEGGAKLKGLSLPG